MEDDLIFFMEGDLNFFENGKRPHFFENGRRPQIFENGRRPYTKTMKIKSTLI